MKQRIEIRAWVDLTEGQTYDNVMEKMMFDFGLENANFVRIDVNDIQNIEE